MLDGKIIRGTTPTHTYILPFDSDQIKAISITYSLKKEPIIKKSLKQCELSGNLVRIFLTQEETLQFQPDTIVEAQIKVGSKDGNVLVSQTYYLKIESILDAEVFVI